MQRAGTEWHKPRHLSVPLARRPPLSWFPHLYPPAKPTTMPPSYGKQLRCSPQLLEDERLAEGSRHRETPPPPSICNRSNYISAALVNLKGKAPTVFVYACLHPRASLCSRARTCLESERSGGRPGHVCERASPRWTAGTVRLCSRQFLNT